MSSWDSGHVVPRQDAIVRGVEAGLCCVVCREEFRVWLWPHDQMLVACGCACMCHQHAPGLDGDGLPVRRLEIVWRKTA